MIYAVRCGDSGPIKFGKAKEPYNRLKELQVAHWESLYLVACQESSDDTEAEQAIHERLKEYRIRGEWFSPTLKSSKWSAA